MREAIKFFIWFISIHAPAWGATAEMLHGLPQSSISIHAPAWGATPQSHT